VSTASTSRRFNAGFWSSASSFYLPVGSQIDPAGIRGYPIDFRVKADDPSWPRPFLFREGSLHIGVVQYGLGAYERWLAGDGEEWLEGALGAGRHLLSVQSDDGAWSHEEDLWHTFPLRAPWTSAITQGSGASLLVRLHLQSGDGAFADAARKALEPLLIPVSAGGVRGELSGLAWPEEYPTEPGSHVLNGAIFGLWGLRDVAIALSDPRIGQEFESGVQSLASNLHRYDTGSWSLYSLFPHPLRNLASSFYHSLHVNQLAAMQVLAPRAEFEQTHRRWAAYAASRANNARAFVWKAAFRLAVPRNPTFARRLPWTRLPPKRG
jgi:heparosan-N-sulfate-glucuronate 5-epimerase